MSTRLPILMAPVGERLGARGCVAHRPRTPTSRIQQLRLRSGSRLDLLADLSMRDNGKQAGSADGLPRRAGRIKPPVAATAVACPVSISNQASDGRAAPYRNHL